MKKIAVNTIKSFLKEQGTEHEVTKSFQIGEASFDVQIRTKLSTDEKSVFINRVLSGCFDRTNQFRPEYFTPMLRATMLQMCTNVPVLTKKGETDTLDLDGMNDLYTALDLDRMGNTEYIGLLQEMIQLCNLAIDWRKSSILAVVGSENAATEAVDALVDMAGTIQKGVSTLTEKVENINTEELLKYADQLVKVTNGLDEGGILKGLLQLQQQKASD